MLDRRRILIGLGTTVFAVLNSSEVRAAALFASVDAGKKPFLPPISQRAR
jgi:hypothetical protein